MQDSMPLFGDMTFLGDPYFSDTATFNSNGCFETAVIIGGQSYTNLLSALNAWVDANDSEGIYRRWAADSTNENGGYPVFAAIPCTPTTGTDSIVVCDSYTWHSSLYTESTTLTDTLVNIAGCDSIVTHHLVVNHSVSRTDTVSAMESYTWADSTYTTSGIYQHTWPAVNGCDSTVNLWLTITTTVYDTLYITLTDTVTNTVYDTITNTVYDTVDNYIYDTTLVTVTDTLWMTEYDTLYITLTDTVYIHDTIYVPQEGIGDVTITNVKLYQREGCIVVEGAAGMTVRVYDAVGRAVSTPQSLRDSSPVSGEQQVRIAVPTSGVYLVKVGDAPVRRVVVIR